MVIRNVGIAARFEKIPVTALCFFIKGVDRQEAQNLCLFGLYFIEKRGIHWVQVAKVKGLKSHQGGNIWTCTDEAAVVTRCQLEGVPSDEGVAQGKKFDWRSG